MRAHLWDVKRQKFIPHIYPEKSPIPEGFDELAIHYHGGTAIAIEAGLLSKDEIRTVNAQMLENVRLSGMPSIGLTYIPCIRMVFSMEECQRLICIRMAGIGLGLAVG